MDLIKKWAVQSSLGIYKGLKKAGVLENPLISRAFNKSYFAYKFWIEDSLAKVLKKNPEILANGSIYDAGANIGYTAYVFSKFTGTESPYKIYAFEPDPTNFSFLQKNLVTFGIANKVHAENQALGSGTGEVFLWFNPEHPADHRIVTQEFEKQVLDAQKIRVPIVSLDEYWKKSGSPPISLVKIDVQGFELEVLRGMKELLVKQPKMCIFFEMGPAHLQSLGFSSQDVFDFFENRHFQLWQINPDGSLFPIKSQTKKALLETNDPMNYQDFLATPPSFPLGPGFVKTG